MELKPQDVARVIILLRRQRDAARAMLIERSVRFTAELADALARIEELEVALMSLTGPEGALRAAEGLIEGFDGEGEQ